MSIQPHLLGERYHLESYFYKEESTIEEKKGSIDRVLVVGAAADHGKCGGDDVRVGGLKISAVKHCPMRTSRHQQGVRHYF